MKDEASSNVLQLETPESRSSSDAINTQISPVTPDLLASSIMKDDGSDDSTVSLQWLNGHLAYQTRGGSFLVWDCKAAKKLAISISGIHQCSGCMD